MVLLTDLACRSSRREGGPPMLSSAPTKSTCYGAFRGGWVGGRVGG